MPTPLLIVRNLKVAFKRENQWAEAVHGIDLDVLAGRTLGLVGESGSGKSVSSLAVMRLLNEKATASPSKARKSRTSARVRWPRCAANASP